MMKKYNFALLAVVALAVVASSAQAAVITSGTFDLGLGYSASAVWDTTETSGSNTAVTGPFTITVTGASNTFTNRGPTFPGRVLTNGSISGLLGSTENNLFTVTATYTGGMAGQGATPLTLVIDSISIYGYNLTNFSNLPGGPDEINWSEVTVGNLGTSPALDLGAASSFGSEDQAANFDQLVWNPGEISVAGTSMTRTFTVLENVDPTAGIDGFEIVGRIEYNAVPEPSALAFTGIGLIGLFGYGRRRKG